MSKEYKLDVRRVSKGQKPEENQHILAWGNVIRRWYKCQYSPGFSTGIEYWSPMPPSPEPTVEEQDGEDFETWLGDKGTYTNKGTEMLIWKEARRTLREKQK